MFGLAIGELAALVGATYLALRVFFAVAQILWWYVTDSRRIIKYPPWSVLVTGVAVALMVVGLLSIAIGGMPRGIRIVAYLATAVAGFIMGIMVDFVIHIRKWRVSDWLMSLRVPHYREQLLYGDDSVRIGAAQRLTTLGAYARPARPELLAAFKDESADVRAAAATAVLYSTSEPADDDVEVPAAARAMLNDPALPVRVYAAAILIAYDAPPAEFLAILTEGLKCKDLNVATLTARGLGKIGPAAEAAIPALRDSVLVAEEPNHEAIDAMAKIGPPAIPALIEVLERGDSLARQTAAQALADMGEPARAALPALRKAANHSDISVSTAARKAIENLGGDIK